MADHCLPCEVLVAHRRSHVGIASHGAQANSPSAAGGTRICGEGRGFDRPCHWRIIYSVAMTRDAIMAELLEIEGLLQDDRLSDNDRHALHGAQQALRNITDAE